ncbi:protein argonaute-2-like [Aphis craccivora]|uniref:Protein argonaute-2-like n=1 Tax=Aphis craccivora TaxID=307492 RepID=A0A6G0Z1P1_APHCR|nr:protein argonaute-2-like [Aphis craccivora]
MVVQKRHHTRIFPKFTHDMDGKFGNVISDTVVDTQITHPTEMDFYLCSHSSIQDASRQTKYHRIWDENYLTEDQLEQLTFYLCFMFARCTRAITYPARQCLHTMPIWLHLEHGLILKTKPSISIV